MNRLWLSIALIGSVLPFASTGGGFASQVSASTSCRVPAGPPYARNSLQTYLLCMINDHRQNPSKYGEKRAPLPALSINFKLSNCARAHSQGMARMGKLTHKAAPAFPKDICVPALAKAEGLGEWPFVSPALALKKMDDSMWKEGPCPGKCDVGSQAWRLHSHYELLTYTHFNEMGLGIYVQGNSANSRETWLTMTFIQHS